MKTGHVGHIKFTRHRVVVTADGEESAWVELEHTETGRKFEGSGRHFLAAANAATDAAFRALTGPASAVPQAEDPPADPDQA